MAEFNGYYRVIFGQMPEVPFGDTQFVELEDESGAGVAGKWVDDDKRNLVELHIPQHPAMPALYDMLEKARGAIESLPDDALGYAEDAWSEWPIKKELLDNIGRALALADEEVE